MPEPVTDAEAELARQIEDLAFVSDRRDLARLVQNVAKSVARGDLDKRRVAILLSALYGCCRCGRGCGWQKTVLAILLPTKHTGTTGKFPQGVKELIDLGVCLKTGFRRRWYFCYEDHCDDRHISPLESVLREILSLRRVQSRNKFLRSTPTLDLLRAALGDDPTYIHVTIGKLTRRDQNRVIRHCCWLPRLVAAAATTGACAVVDTGGADAAVDTAGTGAAAGADAAAMTGAAATTGASAATTGASAATTSAGPVTTTTVIVLVLAAALVFVPRRMVQWLLMLGLTISCLL